jgi:hypothetical protein
MKVGDRVWHIDYPSTYGRIVGKYKNWSDGLKIYLVSWESKPQCSRHIESALRKVVML